MAVSTSTNMASAAAHGREAWEGGAGVGGRREPAEGRFKRMEAWLHEGLGRLQGQHSRRRREQAAARARSAPPFTPSGSPPAHPPTHPPMITPRTICAISGVCVRGEMRASTGGSSQSRDAAMTMREAEKRPTVRAVVMPNRAASDTMYCIHLRSAGARARGGTSRRKTAVGAGCHAGTHRVCAQQSIPWGTARCGRARAAAHRALARRR